MTLNLSMLFRYTTGRDQGLFASLENELDMVRTYLQIEKVRFKDRFLFTIDVAEPSLKKIKLPKFILLPLVENAVTNGVAHRAQAGEIQVHIFREGDFICLRVYDNGPDFSDIDNKWPELVGIQNRLKLIYGSMAKIELQNTPIKQVLVSLVIKNPFNESV